MIAKSFLRLESLCVFTNFANYIKNKTKTEKCHSGTRYSSNKKNRRSNRGDTSTLFQSHSQTKIKLQT